MIHLSKIKHTLFDQENNIIFSSTSNKIPSFYEGFRYVYSKNANEILGNTREFELNVGLFLYNKKTSVLSVVKDENCANIDYFKKCERISWKNINNFIDSEPCLTVQYFIQNINLNVPIFVIFDRNINALKKIIYLTKQPLHKNIF